VADVFRHTWWAFAQVYYDLRALALAGNLLWFLATLPLVPIVGIPGAYALQEAVVQTDAAVTGIQFFVFIVGGTVVGGALAGPGTAALFYVVHRHMEFENVAVRDFWIGFRSNFARAWVLFVVDLCLLYGLIVGFIFYTGTGQLLIQALGFLSLYFVVLWTAAQAYLFPMFVRYDMSIYHLFRNAAVMALSSPGSSIAFFIIVVGSIVLSMLLVFPGVFLMASTLALVAMRMTHDRLHAFGVEPEGRVL
jgi:uncharacterized membrane protein YesL